MLRPKSSVRYRMGGAHCGMCEYFAGGEHNTLTRAVGIGKCKLVEGTIGEDMLCDLYKPKGGDTAAPAAAKPRFAQKANVY